MLRQGSPFRNLCACVTMDRRLINVIQLGVAFMLVFFAFNTSSFIEEIVITRLSKNATTSGGIDKNAGYYSLAIIYSSFTFSNFVAAPIVVALTAKWAMVMGALCYASFMAMFVVYLTSWTLYIFSGVVGFGAAVLWTGQGNYLTLNSNPETIGRNSGIMWALLQVCLPTGGIFLYFELGNDNSSLSEHTINIIYICFTVIAGIGVLCLALLPKPPSGAMLTSITVLDDCRTLESDYIVPNSPSGENLVSEEGESGNVDGVLNVESTPLPQNETHGFKSDLVATFRLLMTREMQLLSIVFFYSGLELTFWSGVYSTCLGFTTSFTTSPHKLVAYNAILIGFGEILGGGAFGLLGKQTAKFGRNPIIILAAILHITCFFLVFLNIPPSAPIGITSEIGYIQPNEILALVCSFLLGLADACWNTQLYAILGSLYPTQSAPAFALFKFFQSFAAAVSFFYSSHLLLHWQLLVLVVFCVLGTLCFMPVEWKAQRDAFNKRS